MNASSSQPLVERLAGWQLYREEIRSCRLAVAFVAVFSALFTMFSLVVDYVDESTDGLDSAGFKGLAGFDFTFIFSQSFLRPGMGLWYIRGLF